MLVGVLSPPIWRLKNSVNIWNSKAGADDGPLLERTYLCISSRLINVLNRTKRHLMKDAIELESCKQI